MDKMTEIGVANLAKLKVLIVIIDSKLQKKAPKLIRKLKRTQ